VNEYLIEKKIEELEAMFGYNSDEESIYLSFNLDD
jgi:hypothetical protein